VLAINKVDRLRDKTALFPVLTGWQERGGFAALVPVSATKGVGVEGVLRELLALLPQGPPLYDEDTLTDRTERFLASELIREQLFLRLRQELPYATAVLIENWQERPEQGDVVVDATIVVEKDSQKGIVVGKGGQMIRDVGSAARAEVTRLLGRPAHLRLQVRVAPDWTSSAASLSRLGYERGE
jgi:GTP-binding protein Era